MALTDIVRIVRLGNSRTPVAQGFGKTAIVAYHTHNTDVYREYTDLSDMEEDGFDTEEPAYLHAQAIASANPRPASWHVVRGPISAQQKKITITTATEGQVVSFDIRVPNGAWQTISYTVLAAATTTTVATAVELLVEAVTGIDSSSAVAVITVTPTTGGQVFDLRNPKNCTILDDSPDPGYASAMNTFLNATKDFYFFVTEITSELAVEAAAAWAEANAKFYFWQTADSGEAAGTGTLGSGQKALAYTYSLGFYAYDTSQGQPAAAAGFCGARDPGSYTLALKALPGITPVSLTTTQETNLKTAGLNWYAEIATGLYGVTGMYNGGLTSGGNLFVDIVHGRDWWEVRSQERLVGVMASLDKVSYDDTDVLLLVAQLNAQNSQAVRQKLFRADPAPVTTAEPVDDQSDADVLARYFPGLKVVAIYAGAVQSTRVTTTFTNS